MPGIQNVIAIDGPAGSGKSTAAKVVAQDLNLLYIDTGAMFRAIAYYIKKKGIDFVNKPLDETSLKNVSQFLEKMKFEYTPKSGVLIQIDGEDLTKKIRQNEVSEMASHISQYPVVRDYLSQIQRDIASKRESVLEGRDIGTVIFPKAKLKIFLTASTDDRAQRRFRELSLKGDKNVTIEQIKEDIEKRDYRDKNREIAPLKKAPDAIEIDTTGMTIGQVVDRIKEIYEKL